MFIYIYIYIYTHFTIYLVFVLLVFVLQVHVVFSSNKILFTCQKNVTGIFRSPKLWKCLMCLYQLLCNTTSSISFLSAPSSSLFSYFLIVPSLWYHIQGHLKLHNIVGVHVSQLKQILGV